MVAETSAAHDSADGSVYDNSRHAAADAEGQRYADGRHDRVGAVGGPRKERDECAQQERHAYQHGRCHPAFRDTDHVVGRSELFADGVDAVSHGQDQTRLHDRLDALHRHVGQLVEGTHLLEQHDDKHVGDGHEEGFQRLGAAHDRIGPHGDGDDDDRRHEEIQSEACLHSFLGLDLIQLPGKQRSGRVRIRLSLVPGSDLSFFHGPEFGDDAESDQRYHEDRKNSVEIEGNHAYNRVEGVIVVHKGTDPDEKARHVNSPG